MLSFENGVVANLIYSGYGYFDARELFDGLGGPHAVGLESRVEARREIVARRRDEVAAKAGRLHSSSLSSTSTRRSAFLSDLGLLVVTCERGELRQSPRGIYIYSDDGVTDEAVDTSTGSPEVQELLDAIHSNRPILHSGRWGLATLEVCLAIMQSHREGREIILEHQVSTPDLTP